MKVALFGKDSAKIKSVVAAAGFTFDENSPEVVIAYGGDGTFLQSENHYPEVPKFLIKNSKTSKLGVAQTLDESLQLLKGKNYTLKEVVKLKVTTGSYTWYALNEVVIRNQNPRHAVRFSLETSHHVFNEVIGDGVVFATMFGSTGYYRSITKSTFQSGIGVAFNNTTQLLDSFVSSDKDFLCSVHILRGPAVVYADNIPEEAMLHDGDTITIESSEKKAKMVIF